MMVECCDMALDNHILISGFTVLHSLHDLALKYYEYIRIFFLKMKEPLTHQKNALGWRLAINLLHVFGLKCEHSNKAADLDHTSADDKHVNRVSEKPLQRWQEIYNINQNPQSINI